MKNIKQFNFQGILKPCTASCGYVNEAKNVAVMQGAFPKREEFL